MSLQQREKNPRDTNIRDEIGNEIEKLAFNPLDHRTTSNDYQMN